MGSCRFMVLSYCTVSCVMQKTSLEPQCPAGTSLWICLSSIDIREGNDRDACSLIKKSKLHDMVGGIGYAAYWQYIRTKFHYFYSGSSKVKLPLVIPSIGSDTVKPPKSIKASEWKVCLSSFINEVRDRRTAHKLSIVVSYTNLQLYIIPELRS